VTNAGAHSANYAFSTTETALGVANVPDSRLEALAELYSTKKITPAVVELADIPGLVGGSSKGEGLGNKFLSDIRQMDAILHVVRCFEDEDVMHVEDSIDPARDIETVDLELIFSDMELLERRIEKNSKQVKVLGKTMLAELELCKRFYAHLEGMQPLRNFPATEDEKAKMQEYALLTNKPVIYVCNFGESDFTAGNI